MILANFSLRRIASYVNCNLCYVTKVKRWVVTRQKRLFNHYAAIRNPQKVQRWKSSALDITYARHSQHVQLKVSLNSMFFRWDWSWTTTQITFMTDMLCTLLLIRLILFLYITYSYVHFSWADWANKILINIRRTIHLPLQKYIFDMPNY